MKKYFFLFFFITTSAFADFLVEPYLGFYSFNTRIKTGGASFAMKGIGYGARLGFNSYGLMGGLSLKRGKLKIPDLKNGSSTNHLESYQHTGFFIGYNFENMIRAWGEFIFTSQAHFEKEPYDKDGSGLGFGGGYYGFPMGSINLEFSAVKYAKYSTGEKSSDKITMMLLSFSLPFVFPI